MHTRTIATLLMSTIEEAMEDTPPDIPTIISSETGESGNIVLLSGIENEGSFHLTLDDGSRFRIDVVRIE